MFPVCVQRLLVWLLWCWASVVGAQSLPPAGLVKLSARPGGDVTGWWQPATSPHAVGILFSGGKGGIGLKAGQPASGNFLIRSHRLFAEQGVSVFLMGNPQDQRQMSPAFRLSSAHSQDVQAVITWIQEQAPGLPIWLMGTSQGSLSAMSAGLRWQNAIAGVVLSASLTGPQAQGALPDLPLEGFAKPVLVYAHAKDACRITRPEDGLALMSRFRASARADHRLVEGGGPPVGNPCQAHHFHGFVGIEARVVSDWVKWMR
jgi:pimeloyl-ACP methyl ester carboxylesterase